MRFRTTAALAMALALAPGCTTAHKRAQNLLDEGMYDDALRAYEDLLREDPKDEEALVGQKKSREGWIDRKLIDVRMLRIAGNEAEGLERLRDIVAKEKEWDLSPSGKVAFTQSEERDYAIIYAEREVHLALQADQPLKAAAFFKRYVTIYDSLPDARVQSLEGLTRESGRKRCAELKARPLGGKPNLARLLKGFCELWGEQGPPGPPVKDQDLATYYGPVSLKVAINGLRPDLSNGLQDLTRKALEASAWYDARSQRPLDVSVTGDFQQDHRTHPEERTQVYTEDEPYDEHVAVQKTRTVPYTDVVNGQVVTKYRDESYTDYETITRHREVHREYHYTAIKHEQVLTLTAHEQLSLGAQPQDIALNERVESSGYEHDENHPSIGLSPSRPNLPDPVQWMQARVSQLVDAFRGKLLETWSEAYCARASVVTADFAQGEIVAKCLRQPGIAAPGYAQQWFKTQFGVAVEDALPLLRYP